MQKIGGCLGFLALAVILLLMFGDLMQSCNGKSHAPTPLVSNSEWDGSVRQVKEYLLARLKNPGSYQSVAWGRVIENPRGWFVLHQFRAKNSFGGYGLETWAVQMDQTGKVLEVTKVPNIEFK